MSAQRLVRRAMFATSSLKALCLAERACPHGHVVACLPSLSRAAPHSVPSRFLFLHRLPWSHRGLHNRNLAACWKAEFVPFHFVKCPEFGFQGYVLGQIIFNLGHWDWIAGFDLLLVVNVTHQAVPLDIRNVLPAGDSSELVRSEATASEVHRALLAPFLARASLAAIRSPRVKHAALFGYLGMVIL